MSQQIQLPGGIVLAGGENILQNERYRLSPVHFFVKTKLAVTDRRVIGEQPNTVLGIIPLGSKKITFPLAQVASVSMSTAVRFGRLILGLILILVGIPLVGQNAALLALSLIGFLIFLSSLQTAFQITNSAGQIMTLRLDIFQRGSAQGFVNQVNTAIAELA